VLRLALRSTRWSRTLRASLLTESNDEGRRGNNDGAAPGHSTPRLELPGRRTVDTQLQNVADRERIVKAIPASGVTCRASLQHTVLRLRTRVRARGPTGPVMEAASHGRPVLGEDP
jgi:hypothetical protein